MAIAAPHRADANIRLARQEAFCQHGSIRQPRPAVTKTEDLMIARIIQRFIQDDAAWDSLIEAVSGIPGNH